MRNTRNRLIPLAALALGLMGAVPSPAAPGNGLGQRPYLGWSSWSLEATKYPGYGGMAWLTAEHVKQQSDALHKTLQAHGYVYVNMDSGWADGFDEYGRPKPEAKKFPLGVAEVAAYVHRNGQKLGIYWIPGILEDVYKANPLIHGSNQHIQDIVVKPFQPATGWGFGYKIDYTQPGAQAYVSSVADQFASWGVDFLKLDGVTPGSDHTDLKIDARPDVAAWAAALKRTGRPIWLELSWKLDPKYGEYWQRYAQGRRITTDVESYGPTLTGWGSIPRAFDAARDWAGEAGPGRGWNDLDSLDIGSGAMDGLTLDERQTVMTLWAISCSPLYTGDDLTKLDPEGLALLTNDEVIAVDQARRPAAPVAGKPGVWVSTGSDGSRTVALFNQDDKAATVTVRQSDLGLTGAARVRDLWDHADLGVFSGSVSIPLAPHASRLFKLVPDTPPATVTATVDPSIQYQTWEGWGTSLAWWAKVVGGYPEPARSEYIEKAFDPVKGLGLNIVRYNIGGGENPLYLAPNPQMLGFRNAVPGFEPSPGVWDWAADANQRWVLDAAIKKGVNQLEAFSNSPPWWMTVSGSVTGGQNGADNLRPDQDAAFADYLTEVTKHFRDVWGITFRDVEPLNEPSGGWHFGGNGSAQEGCHVERPHQNLVVRATEAALAHKQLKTTATASDEPSIGDGDKTFPFYDEAALRGLSKINVHSYGGGDRTQLSNFAVSHGKDLWLSEDGDGDASGLSMARNITDDLNGLHPSAWVTWQVVDSAVGWGFLRNPQMDETTTAYTVNKKYYVMAQYSRFLRPGYKIIALTDPNSVAAWNAKSGTVVFVTRNGGDTDRHITYDLSRFTRLGASVTAYRTSPTEDLAPLPALPLGGKRLTATLPAKSVTTYIIKGAAFKGALGFSYRDYYALVNRGNSLAISGLAISLAGAFPANPILVQAANAGGENQQWSLRGVGGGDYKIINRSSGLALDVNQASTVAGADLIQYSDNGGANQLWRPLPAGGGAYKLVNHNSGLVLSAGGNGATPTQQKDNGSAGQQWRLLPAAK
jgi:O-glycosyl hydrolase